MAEPFAAKYGGINLAHLSSVTRGCSSFQKSGFNDFTQSEFTGDIIKMS
jgi:hypothetical protein